MFEGNGRCDFASCLTKFSVVFLSCRAFEAYIGSLEDMKTDKYSDKERGVEPQTAR